MDELKPASALYIVLVEKKKDTCHLVDFPVLANHQVKEKVKWLANTYYLQES